jgi:hypothetical protein
MDRRLSDYLYDIYHHLSREKWKRFTSMQTLNEPTIVKHHSASSEVVSRNVLVQLVAYIWANKILKGCTYILLVNGLVGTIESWEGDKSERWMSEGMSHSARENIPNRLIYEIVPHTREQWEVVSSKGWIIVGYKLALSKYKVSTIFVRLEGCAIWK